MKSSDFAFASATLFTYQLSPTDGVTTIMSREASARNQPRVANAVWS